LQCCSSERDRGLPWVGARIPMTTINIYRLSNERPVTFAASELRKYLSRASGAKVTVKSAGSYDRNTPALWVGTFSAFPGIIKAKRSASEFDDAIHIDVARRGGIVAGVNPRSVLLAVYRYLRELGFRWVRPGRDGELIPSLNNPFGKRVSLRESPSYRHRCVCIEGASGWQHVRDMIDWLPKLGFNAYYVQFREGYQFFVRWYRHEYNPRLKKERFTVQDARKLTSQIWDECERRGLLVHMVGHGWTCEPFGISGLGWTLHKKPLTAKVRSHLAEIDGKRDLWGGVALNTNLCYGNPETRKIVTRAVADYAAEHPHIPIVHLWLADGSNNNCECPKCRSHLPSDLYVKLCNEVDAELTRRNLQTKIVFLIYVDLLWPPKKEKFKNPDRFILMFAPITRTYTHSFTAPGPIKNKLPPFVRNKLAFPRTVGENLSFLRAWQRVFDGDSFDFDYHLMWDHFKDPGHYRLAEVLCEDIRGLRRIGLGGLNSCQVQRCFLPSGLLMTVMGRTLWNRNVSFDGIVNDLYRATFGRDWLKAKRYTQKLSDLFDPPFLRGERDGAALKETIEKLTRIPGTIRRFMPVIEGNMKLGNTCHAQSWTYLKSHAEICLEMVPALEALARDERDQVRKAAWKLIEAVRRKERRIHRVFDVCLFIRTIGGLLGLSRGEMDE